jgi:hypothetical protein
MRWSGTAPVTSMTTRRAAAYGTFGAILVACLAAANMPTQDGGSVRPRSPRVAVAGGADAIAAEVRSQAARLRTRMAQAPVPDQNPRNPFAFGAAPRRTRPDASVVHAAVVAEELAPVVPPPALILMGVAEETSPAGPRRTAIIAGDADALYMVTEGDSIAGRYKVTKIGADAVELEDVATHGYRRLAMR